MLPVPWPNHPQAAGSSFLAVSGSSALLEEPRAAEDCSELRDMRVQLNRAMGQLQSNAQQPSGKEPELCLTNHSVCVCVCLTNTRSEKATKMSAPKGADITDAATRIDETLHVNKTYACVEGPRLGTRAESFFLRDSAQSDLVGMTNVPEVFLAREAQLAYCTLCLVTDYDCWMDDPEEHVSVDKFFATYQGTLAKAQAVLAELLKQPLRPTPAEVRHSLAGAVLTPDEALTEAQRTWLAVLRC